MLFRSIFNGYAENEYNLIEIINAIYFSYRSGVLNPNYDTFFIIENREVEIKSKLHGKFGDS